MIEGEALKNMGIRGKLLVHCLGKHYHDRVLRQRGRMRIAD